MKKDPIKEEEFYNGDYNFSYTSLNKLLFSPKLFYKDYILKEREERTDKHLIEGKLLHLLILEPEKLHEEFSIVPTKVPSESLKKVLKDITLHTDADTLATCKDFVILDSLKAMNLYQSLKDESKRLAKVRTTECEDYYDFLCSASGKDIIDNDILQRAMDRVQIIKDNKQVMELLFHQTTDFELDPIETYNEKYLECELKEHNFGLKGYVDRYIIDHETKQITIVDIKTTSKSLDKFAETVDFYNYWMQAVIYITLVIKSSEKDISDYKINFNFVVVDNYDQVYVFDVSDNTLQTWYEIFTMTLRQVSYHYTERDYSLPYEFAKGNVIL
tara:strand:- start:2595 stop:3584 length:990 start_codon:yes stop_codon:yes gene_type:complete